MFSLSVCCRGEEGGLLESNYHGASARKEIIARSRGRGKKPRIRLPCLTEGSTCTKSNISNTEGLSSALWPFLSIGFCVTGCTQECQTVVLQLSICTAYSLNSPAPSPWHLSNHEPFCLCEFDYSKSLTWMLLILLHLAFGLLYRT